MTNPPQRQHEILALIKRVRTHIVEREDVLRLCDAMDAALKQVDASMDTIGEVALEDAEATIAQQRRVIQACQEENSRLVEARRVVEAERDELRERDAQMRVADGHSSRCLAARVQAINAASRDESR